MEAVSQVTLQLPGKIKSSIEKIPQESREKIEEIRFRINRPVLIGLKDGEMILGPTGIATNKDKAIIVNQKDLQEIIQILSKNSLYAFHEELKQGYITIPGGHRVGIVGETVIENGKISNQKNISGLNFRISREIIGAGKSTASIIFNSKTRWVENTLLVSPPGAGKTTLLRDLSRTFSDGLMGIEPFKVSMVDERSEIAGSYLGVPQKDVGMRTDVLDGCPKAHGIMLMIRSMSPDLIVTDEIGRDEDILAIKEAINAGVKVLVSAHSDSMNSLLMRKGFIDLFKTEGFKFVIFLSRREGPGTIEATLSGQEFLKDKKIRG